MDRTGRKILKYGGEVLVAMQTKKLNTGRLENGCSCVIVPEKGSSSQYDKHSRINFQSVLGKMWLCRNLFVS